METGTLQFVVESEDGSLRGRFQNVGSPRSNARVDKVLDEIESQTVTLSSITVRLKNIAKQDPTCIEAFATLGNLYFKHGAFTDAHTWYSLAVQHATKVIPPSFSGTIEWDWLDNRPFLRCHHGLAITLMRQGDWPACVGLFERHLRWNPNDNFGIRWLLGDAYTQVARYNDAIQWLCGIKDEYPPARYSLACIYFNQDRHADALTELRKGFLENTYIAELILGAIHPKKHRYWHGSNIAEPEWAREHYEQFAHPKWGAAEVEFLDWAFNCDGCLAERAAYRKHQETLSFERDVEQRSKTLAQMKAIHAAIQSETSVPWIRRVKNRRKAEYWIWESEAYE